MRGPFVTIWTVVEISSFHFLVLSPECFIFVNDFNPLRNPTGGGKKLYMNIPPNQQIGGGGRGWSHEAPRRLLSGDNVK